VRVGEVTAVLKLNLSNFRDGLRQANSLLDQSRGTALATAAVLAGFGGGMVAGLQMAVREATEMQSVLTDLNKVLQLSDQGIAAVAEQLHALARESGIADEALAGALSNIAKIGFGGEAGQQILGAATKAAVAGRADVQQVGDTLVTILRAYNLNASESTRVTDTLFRASLKGRMTFGELAGAIKGLVPVASQLGIGYDQLAAALATMTTVGYDAENSLMGLNMVMVRLTSPSAQLKAALQGAGYASGQALIQAKGLAGAIAFLTKAAGDDELAMIQMAGGARAYKAVAALASNDSKLFAQKLVEVSSAAGSVDQAFQAMQKTFGMQWSRFVVTIQQGAEEIGGALLPALTSAAKGLQGIAAGFKASKEASSGWAGATAAGGAAAFAAAGSLGMLAVAYKSVATAMGAVEIAGLGGMGWLGVVVAAVGIGVGAWIKWAQAQEAAASASAANADELRTLMPLTERAKELAANQHRTAAESKELADISDRLREHFPELLRHYDAEIKSVGALTDALRLLKLQRMEADPAYAAQLRAETWRTSRIDYLKAQISDQKRWLDDLIKTAVAEPQKTFFEQGKFAAGTISITDKIRELRAEVAKAEKELAGLGATAVDATPKKAAPQRARETAAEAAARVKQWIDETQDLYKSAVLNAGEYLDQLNRIAEAAGRLAEQQKKAKDPKWIELTKLQTQAEMAAAEELVRLRDKVRETDKQIHDERIQWTEEERQARAGLYQHELRMLELTRAYALDQLKITRQDSEYTQGLINKAYLDQLAKAKPLEGLAPEVQARLENIEKALAVSPRISPDLQGQLGAGMIAEKQRLEATAATPSPDELSAWAEKYREAVMTAWEQHAISDTEAQQRLAAARDTALQAEKGATDVDRAKFEERRGWHEQMLKMLEDEQGKLTTYVDRASKALSGVFEQLAKSSENLQKTIASALGGRPAMTAALAGWGRVTTETGGRVTNFYYEGKRQTPSPKIRDLMDEIAAELEREQEHPRN
jgi:TP901 family phage tail tape measure protein